MLKKPTKKEVEDGVGKDELVFGPKPFVAKDSQAAAFLATRAEGAPQTEDLDRLEVLVRPFA